MAKQKVRPLGRLGYWTGLLVGTLALFSAPAAMAACRVSDFTDIPLTSLSEIQRLAYVSQMTRTEYDSLKQSAPGSKDYYPLIAKSASAVEAKKNAQSKLESLHIDNSADYAKFWALDYLTDEKLREYVTCSSKRRPGLVFGGRLDKPGIFNLSFAHITPVGVEKIRLQVVASRNITNISQFEKFLKGLGEQDNFTAQTFSLHLSNRNERAVVVMRAGWETPNFVYIPAYPAPAVP